MCTEGYRGPEGIADHYWSQPVFSLFPSAASIFPFPPRANASLPHQIAASSVVVATVGAIGLDGPASALADTANPANLESRRGSSHQRHRHCGGNTGAGHSLDQEWAANFHQGQN